VPDAWQGLLGGTFDTQAHTADDLNDFLHSANGRPVPPNMLHDEHMLSGGSVLWSGGTLFDANPYAMNGFLNMRRGDLAPAHIAFGFGEDSSTLVVRALSLLRDGYRSAQSSSWVRTLGARWAADAEAARVLYPQLDARRQRPPPSDWSCPFRAVAFVGGENASFAPLTPNPVEAELLYGYGGAHPLMAPTSAFERLGSYETTTGACFYPSSKDAPGTLRHKVDGTDASACSLAGVVATLAEVHAAPSPAIRCFATVSYFVGHFYLQGAWALSTVESNFDARCGDIVDAPDTGGELRSGESLPRAPGQSDECGLLHRVRPFLSRTNGRAGAVRPMPRLTTSDEVSTAFPKATPL
jgi:hypothetical protein